MPEDAEDPGTGGNAGNPGNDGEFGNTGNAGGPLGSLDSFQENVRRSGPVASAGYSLIGSILLLGGGGYAIDAWRGTSPWFLLGGLFLGIVVGFYELAKIAFRRRE